MQRHFARYRRDFAFFVSLIIRPRVLRPLLVLLVEAVFLANFTPNLSEAAPQTVRAVILLLALPQGLLALLWALRRMRVPLERLLFFGAVGLFAAALLIMSTLPKTSPTYAQDGVLFTETAAELVLEGQNPYGFDYRASPAGAWGEGEVEFRILNGMHYDIYSLPNPALAHYTYPPFTFLSFIPFSLLKNAFPFLADFRLVAGAALLLLALLLFRRFGRVDPWVPTLLAIILLNPFFHVFALQGYNDPIVLLFIALMALAFFDRRIALAGLFLGLALATKQTALLLLPTVFFFLLSPHKLFKAFGAAFLAVGAVIARKRRPSPGCSA
jgi:uncharacterized membrane protein